MLAAAHGSTKTQHLPFGYFYLGKDKVVVLRAKEPRAATAAFSWKYARKVKSRALSGVLKPKLRVRSSNIYFQDLLIFYLCVYMYAGACVCKKSVRSLGAGVLRKL